MRRRLVSTLVLALLLTVGVSTASADPAVPIPPDTGCPAGYDRVAVEDLEAQGPYRVPRIMDTEGNNNGYICALPLPEGLRLALCGPNCGVPVIYLFRDDDLPATR